MSPSIYPGRSTLRKEDTKLVMGQGQFLDDIRIPKVFHGSILRSPHAHAKIKNIDLSIAEELPGVFTIFTHKHLIPSKNVVPTGADDRRWDDFEMQVVEHPILASTHVFYVGQPIAIVIASTQSISHDALGLIEVTYELCDPVLDPIDASKEDCEPLHIGFANNIAMKIMKGDDDLTLDFITADHVVEGSYVIPRLSAVPMETRGVMASYDEIKDSITVWDSTQCPHRVKESISKALSMNVNNVRVIAPDVGGGFGEKSCIYPEDVLIPLVSKMLMIPVKWTATRQENMVGFHGRGHIVTMKAAVRSDGKLMAIQSQIIADLGAYFTTSTPVVPFLSSHRMTGPYATPKVSVSVLGVLTNRPPTGAYRGAGAPETAFCMERTLDLIGRDLGIDPAEIRQRNLIKEDMFPYVTPTGLVYDSGSYSKGLGKVLKMGNYDKWREIIANERNHGSRLLGLGLATVLKSSGAVGVLRTDWAKIIFTRDRRISVLTGISPHGQGSETCFAQIVSHEFGVDLGMINVLHSDTDIVSTGGGTGANRGMVVGASALYEAIKLARSLFIEKAALIIGSNPGCISFENGVAINDGTGVTVDIWDIINGSEEATIHSQAQADEYTFEATFTLPDNPFSYAAHLAIVEVDKETGEVKLVDYYALHDCGRVINPLLADGQNVGGIVQGIGQALTEEFTYDFYGQPLTGSLLDYAIPLAHQIPNIKLGTQQTLSPTNPLGMKGVGDLSTVAAPVAVANAIMDALHEYGVRHIDAPITSEKIWTAICNS